MLLLASIKFSQTQPIRSDCLPNWYVNRSWFQHCTKVDTLYCDNEIVWYFLLQLCRDIFRVCAYKISPFRDQYLYITYIKHLKSYIRQLYSKKVLLISGRKVTLILSTWFTTSTGATCGTSGWPNAGSSRWRRKTLTS